MHYVDYMTLASVLAAHGQGGLGRVKNVDYGSSGEARLLTICRTISSKSKSAVFQVLRPTDNR